MSGCGLDRFAIFCLVEVGETGGLLERSFTSPTDFDASLQFTCEEVVDGSNLWRIGKVLP